MSPTTQTQNPLLQPDLLHCILDHLAVPHLLHSILDHRSIPQTRPEAKIACRALVALAQTCHALSDPALNYLWKSLSSLEPLVRCYAAVQNEDRQNVPPLSPTDWAIIRRYSRRIKELYLVPIDQVSFSFLQAINPQPFLLFPNLRKLMWQSPTIDVVRPPSLSITLMQKLSGPSLVSLYFLACQMDVATSQALHALLTSLLCSNLRFLCITISATQRASLGSLSLPSSFCDRLQRFLLLPSIDDVTLRHIIVSPKLKEARLALNPAQSRLGQVPLSSDIIPFYNVEILCLQVWDLQFITSLLRNEGQMFHSFSLALRSQPTMPAFSVFLTALLSRQRTYSLRSVTFHYNWVKDMPHTIREAATHTPLYDIIRPLTCLSHLDELYICLKDCFPIDDEELVSLARHWPHLRDLTLSASPVPNGHPWESGKYITLKGLVSLIKCCPQLQRLSLPLDAREVPADIPKGSAVGPSLTAILFSDSPVDHPKLVAEFLARQFLSLRSVSCKFRFHMLGVDEEEILMYKGVWDQVNVHLEGFRPQRTGLVTV